jgi:hypothetical protein
VRFAWRGEIEGIPGTERGERGRREGSAIGILFDGRAAPIVRRDLRFTAITHMSNRYGNRQKLMHIEDRNNQGDLKRVRD